MSEMWVFLDKHTANVQPRPGRLELRKSLDYRGECEAEEQQLKRDRSQHFIILCQRRKQIIYARERDPDKIRADNGSGPGGANLVVGVIKKAHRQA